MSGSPDAGYALVVIVALTAVTFLTRCFFFLSRRELPLPGWLREALRYAPLGAVVAIVAPDVILSGGHLLETWRDARPWAALAAAGVYLWRRSLLETMVGGMIVLLALRLGLGWN